MLLRSQLRHCVRGVSQRFFRTSPRLSWQWSEEKDPRPMVDTKLIVDEDIIQSHLEETKEKATDAGRIKAICAKAREHARLKYADKPDSEYVQGLNLEETATLLNVDSSNEELMNELTAAALDIKHQIYGNRIVLFAPLYVSNYCVNSCTYCGYRGPNKWIPRNFLTKEDLIAEVSALQKQGHRRLLMLTGESPKYKFDQFLSAVETAASVRTDPCGEIRRINVEIPPVSVSDVRRLKETEAVGTFTLFQETYHRKTFARVHPYGFKSNYDYRLLSHDRAQMGGLDDVGIGALFGLYDHRFEVLAMLMHAQHLDRTYGAGPHTISIPRLRPADHAPDSIRIPNVVDDEEFVKLTAIIRMAVPYTGMILSTRETAEMRRRLLHVGISQMSAGSKTNVGDYSGKDKEEMMKEQAEKMKKTGQFSLNDLRPLDQVVRELIEDGFVPSWCTACYRLGRTGETFMNIAKSGEIQNYCHPNALLTLEEYLQDYASEETRTIGDQVVESEAANIPESVQKKLYEKKLKRVKEGDRDLYF